VRASQSSRLPGGLGAARAWGTRARLRARRVEGRGLRGGDGRLVPGRFRGGKG